MRLLTAPEQEFRLREMLEGSRETSRVDWPDSRGGRLRHPGLRR